MNPIEMVAVGTGAIWDIRKGRMMKITKRQLRKIIKESLLFEASDFSTKLKKIRAELEKGNIEAAAKMYADMNEDPSYIGGELEALRFEYEETAPYFERDDAVDGEEFESMVYDHVTNKGNKAIDSSPYKNELLAISNSFTTQVTPDEVRHIIYQPRVRKGQLANVNMEDNESLLGNLSTGMTPDEASRYGTTLEKVIAALESLGATKRTRRKPVKINLPYYD